MSSQILEEYTRLSKTCKKLEKNLAAEKETLSLLRSEIFKEVNYEIEHSFQHYAQLVTDVHPETVYEPACGRDAQSCHYRYCTHMPHQYTVYKLRATIGKDTRLFLRRKDGVFMSNWMSHYLRADEIREFEPQFDEHVIKIGLEEIAAKRIQRHVRKWLEQPKYSNGRDGFHMRKTWEEIQEMQSLG
jgi:hypothetical protein